MFVSGEHPIGRRPQRLAFIEVLVVVGIIAVSLSLAIPAVMHVRPTRRCLRCASQIREFGPAINQYAQPKEAYPAKVRRISRGHLRAVGIPDGLESWEFVRDSVSLAQALVPIGAQTGKPRHKIALPDSLGRRGFGWARSLDDDLLLVGATDNNSGQGLACVHYCGDENHEVAWKQHELGNPGKSADDVLRMRASITTCQSTSCGTELYSVSPTLEWSSVLHARYDAT